MTGWMRFGFPWKEVRERYFATTQIALGFSASAILALG